MNVGVSQTVFVRAFWAPFPLPSVRVIVTSKPLLALPDARGGGPDGRGVWDERGVDVWVTPRVLLVPFHRHAQAVLPRHLDGYMQGKELQS